MIFSNITGNTVTLRIYFSVLVVPHVLRREIHLNISAGQIVDAFSCQIIRISPGVLLKVNRFPCNVFAGLDVLPDLLRFIFLQDRISVIIARGLDRDLSRKRGLESPLEIAGIVLGSQLLSKCLYFVIADLCFPVNDLQKFVIDV